MKALLIDNDEMTIEAVAHALTRSVRWLQTRLAEDETLRVHHYNGRSPRWDEEEFLILQAALRQADAAKAANRNVRDGQPVLRCKSVTECGTSSALSLPENAHDAFEKVQVFRPRQRMQNEPANSRGSGLRKSKTRSSSASSQPLPFRLPVSNT